MRFWVIAIAVVIPLAMLLSLLLPLFTGPAEQAIGPGAVAPSGVQPGEAARGQAIYRSRCLGCHAPEARFAPPHTAATLAKYPDDEALVQVIRAGRDPMPAFTEDMLSEQQLADLLAYLRTLK